MRQTLQITKKHIASWTILVIGLMLFSSIHAKAEGLTQEELAQIKEKLFFFQNRYYKSNAWDCSRYPANAEAGTMWELTGFQAPFDATTRLAINFGPNSDRYLQFDLENIGEHTTYDCITDSEGNKLIITLKLYEANGNTVSTVSRYGTIQGLVKNAKGIFYEQQGHYGTFLTMEDYKYGDGISYVPETGVITKLSELGLINPTWIYNPEEKTIKHNNGQIIKIAVIEDKSLKILDNTDFEADNLDLSGPITDANGTRYTLGEIAANAFKGVELQSLTLPKSITSIGEGAFSEAKVDTLHLLHEDFSNVTVTSSFEFQNKKNTIVYVPVGKLSKYHEEEMEQLSIKNWEDFTYILEEGGKTYEIEYVIDEAYQEAIKSLPVKAPLGQLFTYSISIENFAFNVSTSTEIGWSDLFSYNPTNNLFAIKLENAPEEDKITIKISGSIQTDTNKGLIIESNNEYKEGENGTTQSFNGIIEAGEIKSLQIGKSNENSTIDLIVKGTTVINQDDPAKGTTTILPGTTATLTLSGANDLGILENNGTLIFKRKDGESMPLLGENTTITNNATFADSIGLIKTVLGTAPIQVDETTNMNQEISILRGHSKEIKFVATSTENTAFLSYIWEKQDETSKEWTAYPKPDENILSAATKASSSDNGTITLSEAGEYRCLMICTVPVEAKPTEASSTLTAYVTVKVSEPKPDPDPVYYCTVKIPKVEGATLSVPSGNHIVEGGDSFAFTITLDADYNQSTPLVKANEEIIKPDREGRYLIRWIYIDQEVNISGIIKNSPTSIDKPEKAIGQVWGTDGTLYIHTFEAADVRIVNFSGKTLQTIRKVNGDFQTHLPKGVYIVIIGNQIFKISL